MNVQKGVEIESGKEQKEENETKSREHKF